MILSRAKPNGRSHLTAHFDFLILKVIALFDA
jgi:hypothetical protein